MNEVFVSTCSAWPCEDEDWTSSLARARGTWSCGRPGPSCPPPPSRRGWRSRPGLQHVGPSPCHKLYQGCTGKYLKLNWRTITWAPLTGFTNRIELFVIYLPSCKLHIFCFAAYCSNFADNLVACWFITSTKCLRISPWKAFVNNFLLDCHRAPELVSKPCPSQGHRNW